MSGLDSTQIAAMQATITAFLESAGTPATIKRIPVDATTGLQRGTYTLVETVAALMISENAGADPFYTTYLNEYGAYTRQGRTLKLPATTTAKRGDQITIDGHTLYVKDVRPSLPYRLEIYADCNQTGAP